MNIMTTRYFAKLLASFLALLLSSCGNNNYIMTLDYDAADVSEVHVFLIKVDKFIPFKPTDKKIVLSHNDMVGVGSVKVLFKSTKFGVLEYMDDFVGGGRVVDVSCKEGKIITAVRSSGYL